MLKGFLNIVVNRLIENIDIKILGKLEGDDSITVGGGVKVFYDIFDRFRYGEWFDI